MIAISATWPWKLVAALPVAGGVILAVASWKAGRAVVRSRDAGEDPTAAFASSSTVPVKDPFLGRLVRLTALFACLAVVPMTAMASFDYYDSHKRPHEHATVVAERRVPSGSCTGGHSLRPQYSVTWRSDNAPPGLPPVFTENDSCTFYPAGHSDTIIRRRRIDGVVHVEVSPFDSVLDEALLIAGGVLLSVPIGLLWALWRISQKSRTTP